jgi:hypothetical protein
MIQAKRQQSVLGNSLLNMQQYRGHLSATQARNIGRTVGSDVICAVCAVALQRAAAIARTVVFLVKSKAELHLRSVSREMLWLRHGKVTNKKSRQGAITECITSKARRQCEQPNPRITTTRSRQ